MVLKVLEIGNIGAAGYAGKLFQRWGADVIRIDLPKEPVPLRTEHVAVDLYLHAGKQRIAINIETAAGRDLVRRLAEKVDVLITDVSPSLLEQLDWENLGSPKLQVRVAITSFGLSGPRKNWHASNNVLLAMGGQTFLMGDPGRAPLTMPGRYLFYQSGQYAYTAILATLLGQTEATRQIDVSMLEVALSLSQFTTVMWTHGGRIRERHGNNFGSPHPITMYPCSDGWFAVNVTPDFWPAFVRMLDRPETLTDPRFDTPAKRAENADDLDVIVRACLGNKSRAEILELGQRICRVPTGILASPKELMADTHLNARNFWQTLEHGGRVLKIPGSSFRYVGETQPPQPQITNAVEEA